MVRRPTTHHRLRIGTEQRRPAITPTTAPSGSSTEISDRTWASSTKFSLSQDRATVFVRAFGWVADTLRLPRAVLTPDLDTKGREGTLPANRPTTQPTTQARAVRTAPDSRRNRVALSAQANRPTTQAGPGSTSMCSTAIHLRHRLRISDQSAIRLRNHLSASALSAGLSRWWFPRRASATTYLSGASPRPLPCERWNSFSLPRPNSSAWCANCRWTHGTCPRRHRFRCATWSSTSWWETASLRSCLPASVVSRPGTCSRMTSSESTRLPRWPNRHDTRPRPSPPHHRNSRFPARTATSPPRRSYASGSSTWSSTRGTSSARRVSMNS